MTEDHGAATHFYPVDSNTGILKVMRIIGLSYSFSKKLYNILKKEEKTYFDTNIFYAKARAYYWKYPTTEAMLEEAREWYV